MQSCQGLFLRAVAATPTDFKPQVLLPLYAEDLLDKPPEARKDVQPVSGCQLGKRGRETHLDLQPVESCRLIPSVSHGTPPRPGHQPVPLLTGGSQSGLRKVDHHIARLVLNAVWRHAQPALECDQHTACRIELLKRAARFLLVLCSQA